MNQSGDENRATVSVVTRRTLLTAAAGAAATLGGAAAIWSTNFEPGTPPVAAHDHLPVIGVLSELTIPTTSTAGAVAAGVPEFVVRALGVGIAGARASDIERLHDELNVRGNGDFLHLQRSEQQRLLRSIDVEAFAGAAESSPVYCWRRIKALITIGYYTSAAGAAEELRYELVPGRYDADIALTAQDRAFSTDWSGNAF